MNYWFTSDTHYGHTKIIEYCNRPFKDINHMNEALIRNFNERVAPTDTVFMIGDFCFKESTAHSNIPEIRKRLNGTIIFIRGNHDNNNHMKTCIDSINITLGGREIYLTHKPEDYHTAYQLNLVGHVHKLWRTVIIEKTILHNVGVDVNNFRPLRIGEILVNIEKDLKQLKRMCIYCMGRGGVQDYLQPEIVGRVMCKKCNGKGYTDIKVR